MLQWLLYLLSLSQSFQMLRELSASITGQSRPAGSLGQVAPLVGGLPNNTPSNGEQDDEEEEVMFETKTEGLGHGRKYNIAVNLAEGKLTFKKHGMMSFGITSLRCHLGFHRYDVVWDCVVVM